MKNSGLFMFLTLTAFGWMITLTSCEKYDTKPHEPIRSLNIYGSVVNSSGKGLVNAVVWMKETYGSEIQFHTISNDLGNFTFHLDIYEEHFSRNYTIYISKGGFEMKTLNIRMDTTDMCLDFQMFLDAHDTIPPYCIGWETYTNYETDNAEVIFYFSEEVEFDTQYIPVLAQIIFQRRYDVCNYSSTGYIYEHQDDVYSIGPSSIRFVHRKSDSQTCYNSTSNYSYTQTADWNFHSAQLLPYLCKDLSGNYLEEYTWIGK